MRPTFSIIAFTVLSGTGYGLWFVLGLALAWPAGSSPARLIVLGAGFVFVTIGLVSSLAHLGRPERAWRAFSQWRSSWLSREAIAAIATYVPAIGLAGLFFADDAAHTNALRVLGLALAIGAPATVLCTARIYSTLKPIRAWHNRYVVPVYLLLALYGGVLGYWALLGLTGASAGTTMLPPAACLVLAGIAAALKHRYWSSIDALAAPDAGHATGLDRFGRVCSFEHPHTEENYLLREMGFALARKHAKTLRRSALILAFLIPSAFAIVALALPASHAFSAVLAFVFALTGLFVERWLFFAEARHTVVAYYARD